MSIYWSKVDNIWSLLLADFLSWTRHLYLNTPSITSFVAFNFFTFLTTCSSILLSLSKFPLSFNLRIQPQNSHYVLMSASFSKYFTFSGCLPCPVFIFVLLTYFPTYIPLNSLHIAVNDSISFFLMTKYIFYSTDISHLCKSAVCWWTFRLLPYLSYCE